VTYKFWRGRNYHKRRIQNNKEVAKIELQHFFEDNKIEIEGFDEQWPKSVYKQLEQKVQLYFQDNLKIYLPKDIFRLCETPNELIEHIGFTNVMLTLHPNERNEVIMEKNNVLYSRGIPGYEYLYYFIMNRIPSDIYRLKNPKFEVDEDTGKAKKEGINADGRMMVVEEASEEGEDHQATEGEDEEDI